MSNANQMLIDEQAKAIFIHMDENRKLRKTLEKTTEVLEMATELLPPLNRLKLQPSLDDCERLRSFLDE